MGSFLVALTYMVIEDHKKDESGKDRDPQTLCFYWSICFCACYYLGYFITGGSLNPAICLGIKITMALDQNDILAFDYFYVYLIFPFLGILLALIFYKYVHLRSKDSVQLEHEQED